VRLCLPPAKRAATGGNTFFDLPGKVDADELLRVAFVLLVDAADSDELLLVTFVLLVDANEDTLDLESKLIVSFEDDLDI
jgi:hypothetical protein